MDRSKTRKPHKKSRNGCLPCKARHVKCDEQQPVCTNCVKQGTTCEYRAARRAEILEDSPLSAANFTPASSSEGATYEHIALEGHVNIVPTDVTLNIPQLRLLHHYTTVTAKTLATNLDAENMFTMKLVQTAFNDTYLLYGLFALTALHMNHIGGHSRADNLDLMLQAERYHDAALTSFRADVRDIDDSNFKSVLMFAGTLFPYSCALTTATDSDLDHAFQGILSNVILTRRVRPMVAGVFEAMKSSELGKLIPDDVKDTNWNMEEAPTETELVQLRKFAEVVHLVYPPDIVDAYGQAIHLLELIFAKAEQSPLPPSDALLKIWIHLVTDRYVELLSEKQPGSLIVFAHYAVMLQRAEHYWYLEGVAERILKIADALVPTEWSKWLDWPKEQIRGGHVLSTPGSELGNTLYDGMRLT